VRHAEREVEDAPAQNTKSNATMRTRAERRIRMMRTPRIWTAPANTAT